MRKTIVIIVVLSAFLIPFAAFSSGITLNEIALNWLKPSDIGIWTTSWMLPALYNSASNTTVVNAYGDSYTDPSGSMKTLGGYAFSKFAGIDYMNASIDASYTTFGINRINVGIAVPNAGFDIRYMHVTDGPLSYFDEMGFDVEYASSWPFFPFAPGGSNVFSYIKLFNTMRYIKPAYPTGSGWKQVYSMDYLFRTIWLLPEFALVYDSYTGISQISFTSSSYQSLEFLYKIADPVIARVGVTFADSGPVTNIGANISYGGLNLNAGYEFGAQTDFAVSVGGRF